MRVGTDMQRVGPPLEAHGFREAKRLYALYRMSTSACHDFCRGFSIATVIERTPPNG